MFFNEPFEKYMREMKSFGHLLMPYNYPRVSTQDEDDVNYLKAREVLIDGYNLILHYSKADYGNHFLETFQILGKFTPFLPFFLVCKVGRRFLGNKYLSLVEIFKENRKIYCWTRAIDQKGEAVEIPSQEYREIQTYEGFEYKILSLDSVNFY